MTIENFALEAIVRAALTEDMGRGGDITGQACIPETARLTADFAARHDLRLAGIACAEAAFAILDPSIKFSRVMADGADAVKGAVIARVEGPARAVLAAERVALNFVQRLSGVATMTRRYVEEVRGTKARIADTRKTTPGLRALEKYAVRMGGGLNHRFGLDDAILIKDNHVAVCGGVGQALAAARKAAGHLTKIEVEVDTLAQFEEALTYKPDVIMLDNFTLDDMRRAVETAKGAVVLEASGGVNLTTVRAIAETGVDVISVGALTHSAPAVDIGLDAV